MARWRETEKLLKETRNKRDHALAQCMYWDERLARFEREIAPLEAKVARKRFRPAKPKVAVINDGKPKAPDMLAGFRRAINGSG